jgi:hypothetical protein
VAAPGRRPSLIGAGVFPEEIEKTIGAGKECPAHLLPASGKSGFRASRYEPGSEGFCESHVKNARWILPPVRQLR